MQTSADSEDGNERLNRNLDQLFEEVRVAVPGVQVLFAFLLAVPFTPRFVGVDRVERAVYFATLICAALAAVFLIAPSMHHRILFHRGDKAHLVATANHLAITGLSFLALSVIGALLLVSRFLFGTTAAVIVGLAAGAAFGVVWYAMPLSRRDHGRPGTQVRPLSFE